MADRHSKAILLVEDNDDDYFATVRAFMKAELDNPVQRCTNGDQALDYLFQRGEYSDANQAPRPGIILLDLNLPGTDGRQVLLTVKADASLKKIPVIVLTTSSARRDIERCYEEGANSYIQKPVDMAGFVNAISQLKEYWFEVALLPKENE